MRVAIFGAKDYDREFLAKANQPHGHALAFFDAHLGAATAGLAKGFDAVCAFVNDELGDDCLAELAALGIHTVALRCAGFNNVDLDAAAAHDITVVRVPRYSPEGVAEHAVALILALNRKIYRSYNRVREGNFSLEGLLGFNLHGKTVGVIGTGNIGEAFCRIMRGFGCTVIAADPFPNERCTRLGVEYTELDALLTRADIISLHCPLTPDTHHLIDDRALAKMKPGVMLINTSRGALVDTVAVIAALKTMRIGYLGLDVYEEEGDMFFEDLSGKIITDDVFSRLLTFPNVLITGHQGFFSAEALASIAATTLQNLSDVEQGKACNNEISAAQLRG
ncbi:2-hydroxyacid dehydrogenase [Spongiibacter marinus]|uniref:2-hydroxyacid dehydrogenase n=2 Tax=Spongiibacter marinus TaxID=354246 RepID=UPI00195F3A6B|nr:2-hydroxyacid dehydrogenase [Spongiibacter marinus]MBM7422200.1 D-lactate dehydrogenase [Spongiibacter marinus]